MKGRCDIQTKSDLDLKDCVIAVHIVDSATLKERCKNLKEKKIGNHPQKSLKRKFTIYCRIG
jgi:hypothetical protein